MNHTQNVQNHLSQLKTHLKDFGLNPEDWKLQLLKGPQSEALIRHKKSRSFCFKGEIKKSDGPWSWQGLRLISL